MPTFNQIIPEITAMRHLITRLAHDEAGFIVSSELILIATIGVLAMVVGLAEVANNVNQELEDVGSAFGSVNQSFYAKANSGLKGQKKGSEFIDNIDECDGEFDVVCDGGTTPEGNHNW